ncbi:MAG TPA: DEAD/DEAH box helicase [Dehalococcoidia bacterium]|nr:DEAD/DEAH box helicase [Dehalococcoidia bacterium]
MTAPEHFHPAVRAWFNGRFPAATDAQLRGWAAIAEGRDALIAAPTGSGKTLTAFLSSIDSLLRRSLAGDLPDGIDVVYVSPLKALSSDIQRNLEQPLAEIDAIAKGLGYGPARIRTALRTGDTTQAARAAILRSAPHILITTPESLYLMLTAERSRALLRNVRTVIVDELHALMRDKRGSHLMLSLARLDALCERRPLRIGLSATVHPIEDAARFLVGSDRTAPDGTPDCTIVNVGHRKDLDLLVEVPPSDLQAVATHEQWSDIYDRLAELIAEHRTTLVFVNTRRMAERVAHNLGARLGEEHVAAHHGSLSKDRRLRIEQRLKDGEMRAIVATASLELGIDVGTVDLVCQIGSPRAVTTFLQRIGRSGHALGLTSRGRLFATSRDELAECAALIRAVHAGTLDRIEPPAAPLDILAQQIVAECACREWTEDGLYDMVRAAAPYAALARTDFDDVVEMLSEGLAERLAERLGRGRALLHSDRINGTLRGRRAARITALTSGGAIPEVADYRVVLDPDETFVGTVNEDWAIESMAGDIFLLGSHSWKIRRIESARGVVRVEDAQGRPPSVPFWLGEAPSRTWELSEEVSRLRRDLVEHIDAGRDAVGWLHEEAALDRAAALQLVEYVGAEKAALGVVPSDADVVFERFFDDAGGMQMVVHAPFGGRVNRGLGLALRKRFCVNFDFELQAAATDDAVVLSLGPQHSFPLEDAFHFVRSDVLRESLEQAMLVTPMFGARWRWNATRALAVLRQNGGKKVPPPIQRMRSDDLLAAVFPEQVGCQENLTGPLPIPDHPLIRQTVTDCLYEAMDLPRLASVVQKMESGAIRLHARDTSEPSPFAHEILNAKPYAFLDDAPLEERRTRAVSLRRTLPEHQRDLGALDMEAIERVRDEARPEPRDPDELHDVLLGLVVSREEPAWRAWFDALVATGRAATVRAPAGDFWFAAEHLRVVERLYPGAAITPSVSLPANLDGPPPEREDAVLPAVRGHMEYLGPQTPAALASLLGIGALETVSALARLEGEGIVLRGRFTPAGADEEFCDRRLLARIHRYTLDRLRSEIEPVSAQDFMRYLFARQHVAGPRRLEGKRGVLEAVAQLQGFELPAVAWERDVLPMRVLNYNPQWLDELCLAGEVAWARLSLRKSTGAARVSSPQRATPITLALRRDLGRLLEAVRGTALPEDPRSGAASEVLDALRAHGALFFEDLVASTHQLPAQLEEALWDLVSRGIVSGDGFGSLRQIMTPAGSARARTARRHARGAPRLPRATTPHGRWSIVHRFQAAPTPADDLAESVAMQLLARYGVVFRDLVSRESFSVPWRDVVRALRRQEARGVVRGGRFVSGFIGEQYAMPDAVDGLRRTRREERTGDTVRVNAADPLDLAGIITPGARVPALHQNAVIYRDGVPVAIEEGKRLTARSEASADGLAPASGRSPAPV